MCGISGFIGTKKINDKVINQTLSLMKNRGPDARGYVNFLNTEKRIHINLLHTRLAIIDLDK